MYLQQNCKNTRAFILRFDKDITDLKFGDNGCVKGYWYKKSFSRYLTFTPLIETVYIN
jgi:hypothetical protein